MCRVSLGGLLCKATEIPGDPRPPDQGPDMREGLLSFAPPRRPPMAVEPQEGRRCVLPKDRIDDVNHWPPSTGRATPTACW